MAAWDDNGADLEDEGGDLDDDSEGEGEGDGEDEALGDGGHGAGGDGSGDGGGAERPLSSVTATSSSYPPRGLVRSSSFSVRVR